MADQFDPLDKAETRLAYEHLSRTRAEAQVAMACYDQAKRKLDVQIARMRAKYNVGPSDALDPITCEIKRAPKG